VPHDRPAIFLDRDGVINEDLGHVYRIQDFKFLPGVLTACRRFHQNGYQIVVITNQAGIAKGYYSISAFEHLTRWMSERFEEAGAPLSGVYYCPHHPEGSVTGLRLTCNCRKPAPGLFLRAQQDLQISMQHSIVVGDKYSDIAAGEAAGVRFRYLIGHSAAAAPLTERDSTAGLFSSFSSWADIVPPTPFLLEDQ